jgi:signal transduction histidine kinase
MLDGLGGGLTDKQVHYLKRIKSNVESLDRMVNGLLDLAKIEAGHVTVHFEPIPIMSFLQNLIETSKSAAAAFDVGLSQPDGIRKTGQISVSVSTKPAAGQIQTY